MKCLQLLHFIACICMCLSMVLTTFHTMYPHQDCNEPTCKFDIGVQNAKACVIVITATTLKIVGFLAANIVNEILCAYYCPGFLYIIFARNQISLLLFLLFLIKLEVMSSCVVYLLHERELLVLVYIFLTNWLGQRFCAVLLLI